MTRIRECPVAVKWCFGGPCRFSGVINTRYWPHITGDLTGIVYLVVTLSLNKVAIRLVLPWVMFISIDDPSRQTAPYQHRFMAVLYTIGLCEFPFILGYCAVSLAYIYAIRVALQGSHLTGKSVKIRKIKSGQRKMEESFYYPKWQGKEIFLLSKKWKIREIFLLSKKRESQGMFYCPKKTEKIRWN